MVAYWFYGKNTESESMKKIKTKIYPKYPKTETKTGGRHTPVSGIHRAFFGQPNSAQFSLLVGPCLNGGPDGVVRIG